MTSLDPKTISDSRATLAGRVIHTPVLPLTGSKVAAYIPPDAELFIKLELFQHTGSFKLRGATNTVMSLPDSITDVVAYSSGNHAQAVARAASLRGMRAVIVMPEDAPAMKIEGTKSHGAEVVTYDRYNESREEIGGAIAAERPTPLSQWCPRWRLHRRPRQAVRQAVSVDDEPGALE